MGLRISRRSAGAWRNLIQEFSNGGLVGRAAGTETLAVALSRNHDERLLRAWTRRIQCLGIGGWHAPVVLDGNEKNRPLTDFLRGLKEIEV